MKNEQLKLGLLGIIALTLIVQTYYTISNAGPSYRPTPIESKPMNSNMAAQTASNSISPELPTAVPNTPTELPDNTPKTAISFAQMEHNFGKIKQDSKNTKVFKFTNTGTEPLIISNATGSCGCTVPTFPKEPIAPGKTGEIEVVYSPGKQKGSQTKTVTVTANTEPAQTVINITADVEEV